MSKPLVLLVSIALTSFIPSCAQTAAQAKRGPSTPDERTKALAMIDDLETNPLGPKAHDEREWLTYWLIEVPDIHVSFCTDLLPKLPKGDKQDSNFIATQLMFSGARYAIQHMEGPAPLIEQYQAGVEGALKTYEVLVQQQPKDRQPKLDELVAQRNAGTLPAYVQERAKAGCKP